MTSPRTPTTADKSEHVARLRALIARRLGLALGECGDEEIVRILEERRRIHARHHRDIGSYVSAIERGGAAAAGGDPSNDAELRALGEMLTVGETFFFRNRAQFDALRESLVVSGALPTVDDEIAILSAGASTGEEAYSIAILLRELEAAGKATWTSSRIEAVDLNPRSIATAKAGIYTEWSLREVDHAQRVRFFTPHGRMRGRNEWAIAPNIRASVSFRSGNLHESSEKSEEPRASRFSVIFCRNMLMYFTPDAAKFAIARLTESLLPGGLLFLGHAETLRGFGVTDDYQVISEHDAFYYRKTDSRLPRVEVSPLPEAVPAERPKPLKPLTPLKPPADERRVAAVEKQKEDAESDLSTLLDLLRAERFAEVLARGPKNDLVCAAAHLGLGAFDAAIAAASRTRGDDDESKAADAHVMIGLAIEHREANVDDAAAADVAKVAIEHHQSAIYLDPSFAIAHLHLGRLARSSDEKKRAFGQALELMKRESDQRIALFGGGFSRQAMIAQCESRLRKLSSS